MSGSVRLKLDHESATADFYADTRLLGIVCPLPDFQFSWRLNNHLGFNFRINTAMEIKLVKKNRSYYFSIYDFAPHNRALVHYLYSNEYDGEFLLPELKNFDFLWLMKHDPVEQEELEALMQSLKRVPGVQLVTEVKPGNVKNKKHLLI